MSYLLGSRRLRCSFVAHGAPPLAVPLLFYLVAPESMVSPVCLCAAYLPDGCGAPLQLTRVPGPFGHGAGWLAGCVVFVSVLIRKAGKKRGG